jgi:hypothetical protein
MLWCVMGTSNGSIVMPAHAGIQYSAALAVES